MSRSRTFRDQVEPVPEELLDGKSDKEKVAISRNHRTVTRLKDQESALATAAHLRTATSERLIPKPARRVPSKGQDVVKVRIPKELLKGTTLPPGSGHQLSKNTTVLSDPPTNLSSATSGKSLSPSERIGVLYTPTSNVRTLARNDQMHVYEYQVSYRDTEPPPPPPMPMKDADRGIQGKDPTTSHFLPLDDFDNLEYDRHSPEEWVSLGGEGGAKARSKYYTDKGDEVWAPCHVSSYDVTEELFTINWNHNQATKQVRRLNIIFDEEDEDEWKIRVEEASVLRREAEAQMRLHLYVQSLDEAGNCPINEDQIDRIMYLVAQDFPLDHLHTVETCIGEVRQLYSFALRKAVHDYKMRNPEEMKRLIELHLPVADQAMPDSLDTLLATVDTPSPNFNAAKKAIQQNLFQSHALLNATLHSIHARWRQFESDYFCDTTMKSVSLPCELHIFSDIQSRKGSNVAERLKDDWAASLNTTIQNDLDTHFNFYEEDVERYNSSRMYRFFRMVNTMMSSQLRGLLVDTIQDYTTFMLTYSVQLPDEYSRDSDRYDELPADISERTHWQARREEVLAFHLKLRDDATVKLDVSKKKSKGRREEEVPEQGDVIQEEEEFEPLLFPYEVAPGDFYERIVKMTQVPNGLRPLFVIKLISNGDAVTFYPLLEELEDKVKGVFDSFFSNSEGVRGVGDQLFPLLSLKPFNLHPLDTQDPVVLSAKDRISEVLSTNMEGPRQLQGMYRSFEYILKGDEQLIDLFAKRNPPPTLMDFDVALERLERDCARIANRTMNEVKFELIKVECESVKKALLSKAKELMNAVMRQLESRLSKETRRVSSTYEDIFNRIGFEPTKPEELQELKEYIDQVPADLDRLTTTFQFCTDATNLLSRYRYTIDTDDFEAYWTAFEWPKKVHQQLEDSDFRCKEYRNAFQQELRENCEHLTEEINHLAAQVESLSLDSDERLADKYYEKVMSLEAKIRKHEDEIQLYNSRETLFGLPTTQWAHIKDIKNQFLPFRDLWDTVHKFGSFSEGWMTTGLESLDPRLIDQYVQQWTQKVSSISKKIKDEGPLEVVRHLRDNLDRFRPNIPLIGALRSNLQPSHWKQIYQLVGADGKNVSTENKNLQEYLKMGMLRHINEIEEIAEVARKTFALESDLYQMETDWKKIVFEMEPFGQTYRLRASEATQQTLDEHIMKTQSLLGKPIIRQGMAPSVAAKAANWAKTLDNIQLTLDEWYKCQNTWAYLEPIFSSADISKNMPVEAAKFANINSSWIRIMETTRNNPVVTSRCMDESLPKDLTDHNQTLEEILRKLHAFLETKRMAFPRFYFISNEELLQILSDSKDPYLVQPYLAKCFEGIKTIQFQDNMDITAMESAEGEVVAFSKKVNPADHNNSVELWLQNVETVMMDSIREQLRRAREDYKTRKRTEFIRHWPGQVVLAICSHFWTMEASEAMEADGSRGLYTYYDKCNAQLDEMIVLVRDRGLKSVERKTLEALVVIEVHSRDIVGELAEKGIDSIAAFDWLAQLRYYWTADGHMDVCQINATLRYGYEYLGNSGRLVITQLTDRCYRTLMGALHLNYGGAPEGPAGTGKTETTKDLAKALGKYCVVYNCSDQITAKDMAKLFKGLSQSGSWGCFDEFNRIEIQVLSVIAQQVATIQEAITQKKVEFIFEGAQIKLKMGTAVFITMNPGYAGRAELPDNLKALFRPVAMMVPNYAMIGQIQLFSYGFLHGKLLSEKIVATYRLCSEQLSSQDHYDYGMRAVKAVLTAAGRLKRQYPDEDESVLMLRSIQDVNLPKFLAQDVELFRGIISDLFPSVKLPDPDYEVMTDALVQVCQETNLQPTPYFLEKCFQTYEMIVVRHGMMIVGYSFGGKTKVLHSLASALGIMETTQHENKALLTTMNPKAITMGQLYGIVDQSGEWNDGVLSKAFRTVAKENSRDRKWLVLDGPVDAVWIENMNTVLDDNKKLCLQNGDIIAMSNEMNMIFEVQDLAHASPATVSRCGMVYVEPETLGWKCLIDSYRAALPAFVQESAAALASFDTLVNWMMHPMLEYVRKHAKTCIPQGASVLVASFIKMFGATLLVYDPDADEEETNDKPELEERELLQVVESSFLFALAWALGGPLYIQDREGFDRYLREIISKETTARLTIPLPEGKKQLFDGKYDFNAVEKTVVFIDWLDILPDFKIPDDAEYQSIIVPTSDTAKYSYLMTTLISASCPPLLVGDTGTGKTIMTKSLLSSFPKDRFPLNVIQFSAQTSANDAQKLIDSRCERRMKGVYGPGPNKKMLIFVDDVNMPALEVYGAQPPIELMRQWLDHGGWYNHTKESVDFRQVVDILFIGAMGPPGGGRNPITPRFSRHFNTFAIAAFDDNTLKKIFTCLSDWILSRGYPSAMRTMSQQLVSGTVEVYETLKAKLKPTPEKSHYTFNLRDVSKVFQGISMANPAKIQDPNKMYRLWSHEVFRAFADRFIEQKDTDWFTNLLGDVMSSHFKVNYKTICPSNEPIVFADFLNDQEQYEEITDLADARRVLEDKLEVYNAGSRSGGMNLVIFNYVIEHVARISRILKQPSGNALLIGVGGSGRHSCTMLASHCLGYEYYTIAVTKEYKRSDLHEDIRTVLIKAGQNGFPVTFALSDTQMVSESFLEDISNLLNTGEVPGLFDSKQDQETLDNALVALKDVAPRDATKENLVQLFVDRCKKYLHTVLCFSPVGSTLRERLRKFPGLVNCTTIDWFRQWPEDGLLGVASRFLGEIDLIDAHRTCIRDCFVTFHQDTNKLGDIYLEEARQHTYVTPTSYLELLSSFKNLLSSKRSELIGLRQRYDGGLQQLKKTESEVAIMKEELAVMLPQLERKAKETEELIAVVEKESKEAEAIRATVAVEEEAANKTADKAKRIKDISQAKVDEAAPKLEAAKKASMDLDNSALAEVKKTRTVMEGSVFATVIEGLCRMLGDQYKPKPVRDPLNGKVSYPFFEHAVRTLLNQNFKSILLNFTDKMETQATDENMAAVEKMLSLPSFQDAAVANASKAMLGISVFIRNMVDYFNLNKVVKPLLAEAAIAQKEFDEAMALLTIKKEELRIINEQLESKCQQLDRVKTEKQTLQNKVSDTQTKINRAVKLIDGLGGEKARYVLESEKYAVAYDNVVGDVVLSAGIIAYLGPFQQKYRTTTITKWMSMCAERHIPFSPGFTLEKFLGDPIAIQDWKLQQLPSDTFSVDNAIMIKNALRFPLLIDPQQQANKWIRNMERDNGLVVVRPAEKRCVKRIADCVRDGIPVLLENVGEDLDPTLENLLLKRLSREGNVMTVLIDEPVEWNANFRLYITTKLPRPHYQPEVSTKVALINFMITEGGLQDQLLQKVMMSERRDVEEKKHAMTVEAAGNKASLKQTEDTILELLSSEGSLLDNEEAILELDRSKVQSDKIAARQQDIEAMEKISDKTRQQFVPVAHTGAALFFCVAELANIDPMYQYSLQFYISLFQSALVDSEAGEEVEERISNIISTFQFSLYKKICRSLFAKDQLLFSFIMCVKLFDVDPAEVRWLLMGGLERDAGVTANPYKEWLPDLSWKLLWRASTQLPAFASCLKVFVSNQEMMRTFYESSEPLQEPLPAAFANFTGIQRLILVRCLRLDKVVPGVSEYVNKALGERFVEPPLFNLEQITDELQRDSSIAIIFVLSAGADPNAELDRVAELRGMSKRLFKLSLGQGQDVPAKELLNDGKRQGNWVLLQNCHLYRDFMPELANIIEEYSRDGLKDTLNKDYRLFLTSLPSDEFPVSVLQNGMKLVQEPPKGLRSNLLRSFTSDPIVDPKFFESSNKPEAFKKLLFGLTFFHSLVQERRKFGPLGWNRPYEFNDTDMRISVKQLHMFINENPEVPYEALSYLVGECNYGGRVTDDWDRRCLLSTLNVFFTPDILLDDYRFSMDSPEYYSPEEGEHSDYVNYIQSLPWEQKPGIFGLHGNADITKDERDARLILEATLTTQPREASGKDSALDPKKVVLQSAKDVHSSMPKLFDIEEITAKYPLTYGQSMNTVLLQELIRYNRLLAIVRSGLDSVQLAIRGEVVMSADLEQVYNAIYDNKIPEGWRKRSFPSLKPFGSYIADLLARLAFLQKWIDEGPPPVFWISGFFFTQSFLTGIMQNYARKYGIEIDKLVWDFTIMTEDTYDKAPDDGCFINGLFLEGAGWNNETGLLCESKPKELYVRFPIIYMKPIKPEDLVEVPHYRCPTYKTTDRQGVLSTTGHSTNFIMVINLPRRQNDPESYLVMRGTALFTQLNY